MLDRIAQFRQSFQTRKAEQNDTRQDIQHHDPDFFKKQNQNENAGFKDPYEDLTDVSITALITFLEGLLDRAEPIQKTGDADDILKTDDITEYRAPVDPAHAKAMNAYQARTPYKAVAPKPAPVKDKPQTALDQAAANLDQNAVKSTIRDLRALLSRGIDHISLERGDGFLQSIQNAVAKY
jgi:hypothetical protein